MGRKLGPTQREATILQILVNKEHYGLELKRAYESQTGQRFPLGSVYVTLDRMQKLGLIKSADAPTTNARGGNRRSVYSITANGVAALDSFTEQIRGALGGFGNAQ